MNKKIVFVLLYSICAAAMFSQPALTFEEEEIQLGEMDEGQVRDLEFKFKNTGTTTLIIKNIRADCGCTATKLRKKSYKPGEEGVIQVKFSSHNLGGRVVNKRITVSSNDPARTYIRLQIKGKITLKNFAKINLVPNALRFGKVTVGDTLEQVILVSNTGTIDLKIMEFAHSPDIIPDIQSATIAPREKGKIKITYRPSTPGSFTTYLKIRSNAYKEYLRVIKITAQVEE